MPLVKIIDFGNSSTSSIVTPNEDGTYTIFINARLTHEKQCEAYTHELKHIMNNDFEKNDVDYVEAICHG